MSTNQEPINECVKNEKTEINFDEADIITPEDLSEDNKDIRCGLLTGKLIAKRFVCPGIHKKCIIFDGQLITPRQFTIKAEKDKQKDWKGSIRLGKHNLRTLMELKTIDFFDHEKNCSLKCQSRNYIKNRKKEANDSSSTNETINSFNNSNVQLNLSQLCQQNLNKENLNQENLNYENLNQLNLSQQNSKKLNLNQQSLNQLNLSQQSFNQLNLSQQSLNQLNLSQQSLNQLNLMQSNLKQKNLNQSNFNLLNSNQSITNQQNLNQRTFTSSLKKKRKASTGFDNLIAKSVKCTNEIANTSETGQTYKYQFNLKKLVINFLSTTSKTLATPSISTPLISSANVNVFQKLNYNNDTIKNMLNLDFLNNNNNKMANNNITDEICLNALNNLNFTIENQLSDSIQNNNQNETEEETPTTSNNFDNNILLNIPPININSSLSLPQISDKQQNNLPSIKNDNQSETNQAIEDSNLVSLLLLYLKLNNTFKNLVNNELNIINNNNNNVELENNNTILQNKNLLHNLTLFSNLLNSNNLINNQLSMIPSTSTSNIDFLPIISQQNAQLNLLNNKSNNINLQYMTESVPLLNSQNRSINPELIELLNSKNLKVLLDSNPPLFWSTMRHIGVSDDLLNTLTSTINELKQLYLNSDSLTADYYAIKLTEIAKILNLNNVFVTKIQHFYTQSTLDDISKELDC